MTKEAAIKIRDEYNNSDSPYIGGAWITNKHGTEEWFVDVNWHYAHRPVGEQDDFEMIGY